jgi:tetratricopeptide (TPR) repeat protein
VRALILVTLFCAAAAHAAEGSDSDVDEQVARRHYAAGKQFYEAHRYREAIKEFETARRLKPLPAFDYNIGRCYDLSEQWKEAAEAYERYLAAAPHAPDAASLRTRIVILRKRVQSVPEEKQPPTEAAPPPPLAPPPEPPKVEAQEAKPKPRPLIKRPWFWATLGGVAVVGLSVGLGVGLGSNHDPTASYGRIYGN